MADGETELVPSATLEHVRACADCAREIQVHRVLAARLRAAIEQPHTPTPARASVPGARRIGVVAAALAAAIVVATAGSGWYILTHPDPVQAAVTASSQPMQMESTDPAQVGQWCLQASGRTVPAIQLDRMQVVGARMDRVASTDIVTVVYSSPSGARVTVSWLEGQAPSGSGVEDRTMSGRQVLVVHSAAGTAVILGSSSEVRWEAAAAIEKTAG